MQGGVNRCSACGRIVERKPAEKEAPTDGDCSVCGAPLDDAALSRFANRLARFGLGARPEPLFGRTPELPDAK
jgi:hypothetical protein